MRFNKGSFRLAQKTQYYALSKTRVAIDLILDTKVGSGANGAARGAGTLCIRYGSNRMRSERFRFRVFTILATGGAGKVGYLHVKLGREPQVSEPGLSKRRAGARVSPKCQIPSISPHLSLPPSSQKFFDHRSHARGEGGKPHL